jgi:hypothetical protein
MRILPFKPPEVKPAPKEHWYNCWLFHHWGMWNREDVNVVDRHTGKITYKVTWQARICVLCGKKQWDKIPSAT